MKNKLCFFILVNYVYSYNNHHNGLKDIDRRFGIFVNHGDSAVHINNDQKSNTTIADRFDEDKTSNNVVKVLTNESHNNDIVNETDNSQDSNKTVPLYLKFNQLQKKLDNNLQKSDKGTALKDSVKKKNIKYFYTPIKRFNVDNTERYRNIRIEWPNTEGSNNTLNGEYLSRIINEKLVEREKPHIDIERRISSKESPLVKKFLDLLIIKGGKQIKYAARELKFIFGTAKIGNPTILIENAANSFQKSLKHYIDKAMKGDIENDVELQYLFLDIVTASNMMLHRIENNMVDSIINRAKSSTLDALAAEKIVTKNVAAHKKGEMKFLCKQLNICRHFPGFIDNCIGIIDELLQLNSIKLNIFVTIVEDLVTNRVHFFKSFMREDIIDNIRMRLADVTSSSSNVQDVLRILKEVIKHRYKLMKVYNKELVIRTKSVRLLFDIIDNSFILKMGELSPITFDNIITALMHWRMDLRENVDLPLKLFFEHVVGAFRNNWDINRRKEVLTLTELMMTGKADDEGIQHRLFTQGPSPWKDLPIGLIL